MKKIVEFIINNVSIEKEELQKIAEKLRENFKERYRHVGVRILPYFSEHGTQIGWKIVLIAITIAGTD